MTSLSSKPRADAGLVRSLALPVAGLFAAVVLVGTLMAPVDTRAAGSEPNEDLGPELRSLIAKERIRQRSGPRGSEPRNFRGGVDTSQDCGSVDIGNSAEARGRSARERVNPRQQTVIVTGPVVNAARCR
jgi:hypothetical protein